MIESTDIERAGFVLPCAKEEDIGYKRARNKLLDKYARNVFILVKNVVI